jgi:hypothetical protein
MKVSAQSARKNVVPALVLLEAWEESDETGVSSRTSLVNHLRSSRLSIAPNGWKRGRKRKKKCIHVNTCLTPSISINTFLHPMSDVECIRI